MRALPLVPSLWLSSQRLQSGAGPSVPCKARELCSGRAGRLSAGQTHVLPEPGMAPSFFTLFLALCVLLPYYTFAEADVSGGEVGEGVPTLT